MLDLRRYTWVDRGEIQHVAATDEATQSLQASQHHAVGPLKTKVDKIIVSKKKETNNFPGNLYFPMYVTVENQTSAHISNSSPIGSFCGKCSFSLMINRIKTRYSPTGQYMLAIRPFGRATD